MTTTWLEASEVVAGLILQKRLGLSHVRPEIMFGEYANLIKYIKNGVIEPEELITRVGPAIYNACLDASKNLNGAGELDWVRILEKTASNYQAGTQLEKLGRKLQYGEEIDWSNLSAISSDAQRNVSGNFTPLSEVTSGKVPFIKSGWKPFDDHIGGYPTVGTIVVGGNPGVGKTTFMTIAASSFVKEHRNKYVAIFSLEMILEEIAGRFRETNHLNKDIENRILLNEFPVSPEEVINKAATIDNLGLICIDFADLMIRGETTESAMAHIYRTLMLGAKQLRVPIILLSQLNRAYSGGIPRPNNLRYTGMAEALCWMILMLYNPSMDYFADDEDDKKKDLLPVIDNVGYIIIWKVRGGFREHLNESPGAIQIPFIGSKGWHPTRGHWFNLRRGL